MKKQPGFTLIELMIVVAIIGILAGLALPKFAMLVEKSREATTKGNLNGMRSAISIYYGDKEGIFPEYVETSAAYDFSKYLERIAPVKATHAGIGSGTVESPEGTVILYTTNETISASGVGWRYNSNTGRMFVNSNVTDSKGTPYSTYGY